MIKLKFIIGNFLNFLLPLHKNRIYKNIIEETIKKIDKNLTKMNTKAPYIQEYLNLKLDYIYEFYEYEIKRKETLEDKAKGLSFALTVTVSFVLGLGMLLGQKSIIYKGNLYLTIGIILLALFAVWNIVCATFTPFESLLSLNTLYRLSPEDFKLKKQKKKIVLAYLTVLNNKFNTLRTNNLYTSYTCIRYFLISLLILFCVFIFSFALKDKKLGELNNTINELKIKTEIQEKTNKTYRNQINLLKKEIIEEKEAVNDKKKEGCI